MSPARPRHGIEVWPRRRPHHGCRPQLATAELAMTADMDDNKPSNWRDYLAVHPAAELFPLMSETDPAALKELAEDISKNALFSPIVFWSPSHRSKEVYLLDGEIGSTRSL
jgi:hypothetical protein